MMQNLRTNWWGVITTISGVGALTSGFAGLIWGVGGVHVVGYVVAMVSGSFILGGLAIRHPRSVAGSRAIAAGAALGVVFMLPAVVLIIIGGLWTGHLQLSDTVDETHLQPVLPQDADIIARWYLLLVAAPILFAIGLGAIAIAGESTGEEVVSLIGGLLWLTWILSWFGALFSTGFGILFGIQRGIARHRTRPA